MREDRGDAGDGVGARHAAHAGAAVVELWREWRVIELPEDGVCVRMYRLLGGRVVTRSAKSPMVWLWGLEGV